MEGLEKLDQAVDQRGREAGSLRRSKDQGPQEVQGV